MKWDELSIRERSQLMNLYMKGGVLSLKEMKSHYNSFADGGPATASGEKMTREAMQWMWDKNGQRPTPEFWNRLRDPKRETIPDWENPEYYSTHKMGYGEVDGRTIVYPDIQRVNGKLVDYSRPPYSAFAGLEEAMNKGDYVVAPNERVADNFTKTYKQYYPGFSEYDSFSKSETDRNTFHTNSRKADYIYRKAIARGIDPLIAASIIGSSFAESGLDEYAKERGNTKKGEGLMQWTDSTRKANMKAHIAPDARDEFERQVDFIFKEIEDPSAWKGGKGAIKKFKESRNVKEASKRFTQGYLNPKKGSENFDRREQVAGYYKRNPPELYSAENLIFGNHSKK